MKLKNVFVLLVIGFAVGFVGCKTDEQNNQIEKTKFVKVEQVGNLAESMKLMFNGSVKEKSLTTVSFRVGGPLTKLNVKSGDFVEKGQLIAEIDKRDYNLQVKTSKAQFEQLEAEYNRYKELFKKDKIPANSFEKIKSGYLMAKTGYENAVNQLNDTELKAPVSGYVYEKKTENFQTIGPGQPIVSIIDISELEVVISVPENQLSLIKDCNTSFLTVKNANVYDMPVSIFSISEKAKGDGLFEVKYILKNKENLNVSPGMTAEILMLCQNNKPAISIPSSAIFNDGKTPCVWIYNAASGEVTKREIKVKNFSTNGRIEVTKGVKVGDTIVTAGVNSIIEGQMVQPIKAPSKTNIGGLL